MSKSNDHRLIASTLDKKESEVSTRLTEYRGRKSTQELAPTDRTDSVVCRSP